MKDFELELQEAKQELEAVNQEPCACVEAEKKEDKKVVEKDGITYIKLTNGDTVELRLEDITGNLIIAAKNKVKQLRKKSDMIVIEELDDYYYIFVAEMIGNKNSKYLLGLKFKDYNLVKNVVRNFLSED